MLLVLVPWFLLVLQCVAGSHSMPGGGLGREHKHHLRHLGQRDDETVSRTGRPSSSPDGSPSFSASLAASGPVLHQRQSNETQGKGSSDDDDSYTEPEKPGRLADATESEIELARKIVNSAIRQAAEHNKARLAKPMRNNYSLRPGTIVNPKSSTNTRRAAGSAEEQQLSAVEDDGGSTPPLLNVTQEMAAAAALVAEAEAYEEMVTNSTLRRRYLENQSKRLEARHQQQGKFSRRNRESNYWLAQLSHVGGWPFGDNGDDFPVFRDVTDSKYGAVGDGVTDDTEAIRKAVSDGDMCGPGCYSSTTKGAIIYFPPGEYLVSGTIETYFGTQFIGDPLDRPIIKAASSFVGLGVISTDKYVENGGEGSDGNANQWFINTANFYRQIRNFVIDITATDPNAYVAALHYQVAQATSLQFVEFRATTGTTQQGIFAENGSGGFISDLVFNGGNFGIYGGAQQFTVQRVEFNGCKTAVQLIWDWGWAWKSVYIKNAEVGFKLLSEDGTHNTGSLLVVDSVFEDVGQAILMFPAKAELGDGTTGLTLDNIRFDGTDAAVVDNEGKVYLDGDEDIDTFVLGRIYMDQEKLETLSDTYKTVRDPTLTTRDNPWSLPKLPYFERAKPQYEDASAIQFHHIQRFCKGDGVSDDTNCIKEAFELFGDNSIIYFDAGSYMISDTITIPNNAKIVGENWAQLVAYGENFEDEKNPRPLIKVGEENQRGTVEMQDLIFTSKGPTAGVVFVEWNLRSDGPGSAGIWDCHVRVGGAVGTELTVNDCPAGGFDTKCKAGSALMHITPDASGYFENVWLWVADHDIDDPSWEDDKNFMEQCSIYVARGLLVESTTATFLYGTSSEHAVFYQYELHNAKNLVASMIQTESPYYQPNPNMPSPFENAVGKMPGDPTYNCDDGETCDSSWALRIINSSDIMIHGAGLYSWFDDYTQECLQTIDCQTSLIDLQGNFGGVKIHNLITIGAVNMIESDGMTIKAADNQAVDFHPRWSQIAVFDPKQFTNPCTQEPDNSNPDLPSGEYLPYRLDDEDEFVDLTIVNGSPYDFEFLGENSWQMTDWEEQWIDIPAGESLSVTVQYSKGIGINNKDSAGEAYYRLKGTDKKWHVTARWDEDKSPSERVAIAYTDIGTKGTAQGTVFDLGWPTHDDGVVVQWVLTGSETYGYYDSANPPVAWMQAILDIIGDRKLKHICMPGSHDAGMSKIDGKTAFASWQNTQTQWLDIYGQAVRGSRWFDIRPCIGNGGKHMLCHYTVTSGSAVGANGLEVDDAIDQINRFMNDHPGELLILDLNDESAFNTDDRSSAQTYDRLTDDEWEPIWKKFRDNIERPCKNLGTGPLDELEMNDFIGDGKGCVLTVSRGAGNAPRDESRGFYPYGQLPRFNQYANTESALSMAQDQIAKLKSNRRLGSPDDEETSDEFFILSWTLTLTVNDFETPIANQAARALTSLFWFAYTEFTPYSFPNVLYVDYVGQGYLLDEGKSQDEYLELTQGHMTALAMAVNLQIASRNCYIGGGTIFPS